ncbi:hypothetical protein LJC58_09715 [Lachnospiraceae bacterium OttesenSCG-928-D06]|nr:hypothetical protein [Lachnospiraceae bacterium OttesenSCG-928-D06]
MMKNMYSRTCRQCATEFLGGPRAWYCLACRDERLKERRKKYQKNGFERHIGDSDKCIKCGETYIIIGGLQRYCEKCASDVIKEIDRKQGLEWYHNNSEKYNPNRNESRRKRKMVCMICGREYPCDGTCRKTCSPECNKIRRQENQHRADVKRKKG